MGMWRKQSRPIDRAVRDLDRQIAAIQKQMRDLSQQKSPAEVSNNGTVSGRHGSSASNSVTSFFRQMLSPAKKSVAPSYHSRRDLFDIGAEPLRELEPETAVVARKHDPELYSSPGKAGESRLGGAPLTQSADSPNAQEKLAHYLSAGSIKTYRPIKRVQRQARNRFFMWIGLSFFALWLIYVVAR